MTVRKGCRTCRYMEPEEGTDDEGTCHRYAPVPVQIGDEARYPQNGSVWPMVRTSDDASQDWCGEWAAS